MEISFIVKLKIPPVDLAADLFCRSSSCHGFILPEFILSWIHSAGVHLVMDSFCRSSSCHGFILPEFILSWIHSAGVHFVMDSFCRSSFCHGFILPEFILSRIHSAGVDLLVGFTLAAFRRVRPRVRLRVCTCLYINMNKYVGGWVGALRRHRDCFCIQNNLIV